MRTCRVHKQHRLQQLGQLNVRDRLAPHDEARKLHGLHHSFGCKVVHHDGLRKLVLGNESRNVGVHCGLQCVDLDQQHLGLLSKFCIGCSGQVHQHVCHLDLVLFQTGSEFFGLNAVGHAQAHHGQRNGLARCCKAFWRVVGQVAHAAQLI